MQNYIIHNLKNRCYLVISILFYNRIKNMYYVVKRKYLCYNNLALKKEKVYEY